MDLGYVKLILWCVRNLLDLRGRRECNSSLAGYCYDATLLIKEALEKVGYPEIVYSEFDVKGSDDWQCHYCVYFEGYILDVTATQFGWPEHVVIMPVVEASQHPWWSGVTLYNWYPN